MLRSVFVSVILGAWITGLGAAPAALVEDIESNSVDVELLDYLDSGMTLVMGKNDRLVISYLASCIRERILGGTVQIGETQSVVSEGDIERTVTECDGGRLALRADQAINNGAIAMRNNLPAEVSLTVFDVSPVFILPRAGWLVIKRIDHAGERHKLQVAAQSGRTKLDLAEHNIQLQAGATYLASMAGRNIIFKVDDDASHGRSGLVERVIPL